MDDGNCQIRKLEAGINCLDPFIVPIRNFFEVDIRENVRRELQLALLDPRQINDDRLGTSHGGNMKNRAAFSFGPLLLVHDSVRGAEVYGLFLKLLNAPARANGLIVYLYAACL